MPAKDIYHDNCKNALIRDDWIITHDPLRIQWGTRDMYIDLGAEQLMAAERGGRKIAVEVKSFVGSSEIEDLKLALGQYVLYRNVLGQIESDRDLYLAIRRPIFRELFEEPIGQLLIENEKLKLIVFDAVTEAIVKWVE
jgi:hypothetical protein